jgi:hypothetical protein
MCDNHGLCSIDPVLNSARCYCNTGNTGNDCQTVVPPTSTVNLTTVLVVIVVVLLILLITLSVILYYKVQKLNSDDMAFAKLDNGDDNIGGLQP